MIFRAGSSATGIAAKAVGGKAFGVQCDIGDPDSVKALFDTVNKQAGKLDVQVNAAAIVPFVAWDELTFEEWRRVMRVNLKGAFLCGQAAARYEPRPSLLFLTTSHRSFRYHLVNSQYACQFILTGTNSPPSLKVISKDKF